MSAVSKPLRGGKAHNDERDYSGQTKAFGGVGNRTIPKTPYGTSERQHRYVVWLTLIGIVFPPVLISLGGINLTPGRLVAIVFFVPALGILFGSDRNRVVADFFAVALATWMLASSALNGGFKPYVGAEALELLGAFMIGRAFVFGPSNFQTFVRALGPITAVLVVLAVLDISVGRHITLDSFGVPNHPAERFGKVRAASVFEGAEHYGTYCAAAASIFLYSERGFRRVLYVGVSVFGCVLSLSSGPLLGLAIITFGFSYDCILKRYAWRWKALVIMIACFIVGISLVSDHPVAWIILHVTLDPQTGFFRLATWDFALPLIGQSPFVGYGLIELGDSADALIFLRSVDSLWLLEALRYGLPAVILLVMTIFSPLLNGPATAGTPNAQTGLTLAIVAIALIGLTVHFWDAPWLFLNLCVGIRASFAEYQSRTWQAGRAP